MVERYVLEKWDTDGWPEPGSWFVDQHGLLHVVCGGCGEIRSADDHTVDEDGRVHASLLCGDGCGWHVWGELEGWEG